MFSARNVLQEIGAFRVQGSSHCWSRHYLYGIHSKQCDVDSGQCIHCAYTRKPDTQTRHLKWGPDVGPEQNQIKNYFISNRVGQIISSKQRHTGTLSWRVLLAQTVKMHQQTQTHRQVTHRRGDTQTHKTHYIGTTHQGWDGMKLMGFIACKIYDSKWM